MFESIASGAAYPISQYTEHIFIGSVYDRTTPSDWGTDCDEADVEEWKTQSPSELHMQLTGAPSAAPFDTETDSDKNNSDSEWSGAGSSSSGGESEDRMSESIQRLLCGIIPGALRKFSVLNSFK